MLNSHFFFIMLFEGPFKFLFFSSMTTFNFTLPFLTVNFYLVFVYLFEFPSCNLIFDFIFDSQFAFFWCLNCITYSNFFWQQFFYVLDSLSFNSWFSYSGVHLSFWILFLLSYLNSNFTSVSWCLQ